MKAWKTLSALGIATLVPNSLGGIITPLDQFRGVESHAAVSSSESVNSNSDTDEATGFALFNSAVDASAAMSAGPDTVHAVADASQYSDLLATSIVGLGTAEVTNDVGVNGLTPNSSAVSYMNVTFDLDEDTPFTISGSLSLADTTGSAYGFAGLALVGPDGVVVDLQIDSETFEPIASGGTLLAGEYVLDVFVSVNANGSGDALSGNFNIELNLVPEPAPSILIVASLLLRCR